VTVKLSKEEINEWLHNQILTVIFDKVSSGTEREMRCTLLPEFLPLRLVTENTNNAKYDNPDIVRVYDLDKHAWRSFRIDRVKDIKENVQ
jgi:hypothetical protein